jgi:hypothetical protein
MVYSAFDIIIFHEGKAVQAFYADSAVFRVNIGRGHRSYSGQTA